MKTLFKNKIFIIVAVILVLVIGYYIVKGGSGTKPSSGVTKQAVGQTANKGSGSQAGPGQIFVSQLLAIQNIVLDLDLFDDPVFLSLRDFHKEIADQPISRPNPFAPVDLSTINVVNKPSASASTTKSTVKPKTSTGRTE